MGRWEDAASVIDRFTTKATPREQGTHEDSDERKRSLCATELAQLHTAVERVRFPPEVRDGIIRFIEELFTRHKLDTGNSCISDRTFLVKAPKLLRACAVAAGRDECMPEDLRVLEHMMTFRLPEHVEPGQVLALLEEVVEEARHAAARRAGTAKESVEADHSGGTRGGDDGGVQCTGQNPPAEDGGAAVMPAQQQQQQQQLQQLQQQQQQHLEQQHRQFEEQQRQAHRPAASYMQAQQCLQQQAAWQECMNAAAHMPSEDPSLLDSVSSLAPAARHRAGSSDWQSAPTDLSGGGAVSTLPLLMSRLGGLMAMCGSNNRDRDPAVAISQALAMLPQAVAAGQLSPGAAALLMQALQQQVNAIVGGGWAPAAAACHAGNSYGFGAHGDSQTFVSTGSLASSPLPSRRQPLPSHLGGPPDWWHAAATSQMPPNAANHQTSPFFTAAVPEAAAPAQEHAAAAAGPAETEATSVDALLLLSACADMQRSSSSSSSSTSRSGSGADAPFPTDRAAGALILG